MKHTILIIGLATLVTTASVTSAQETQLRRARLASVSPDGTATITADKDAELEEVAKAADKAKAAGAKTILVSTQDADPDRMRLRYAVARVNTVSRNLVVPKDVVDPESMADMEEDMNVMSHILDKSVRGSSDPYARAMGITVSPKSVGAESGPQNLYIEGHGALFFLNVNVPLLPPPDKEAEPKEKTETSSEWEAARREITQPDRYSGDMLVVPSRAVRNPYGASPKYDAGAVNDLKRDLINALKNSAHIRGLKPDETVTVVVTGPGWVYPDKITARTDPVPVLGDIPGIGKLFRSEDRVRFDYYLGNTLMTGSELSSRLILRVRKSDAEAFQKGDLTFDEFRKQVSEVLY